MRNTLMDLNNALFEAIERIQNDELTDEQLESEIKRAEAVSKVSDRIIHNAELAFRTMQHLNEYGYDGTATGRRLAPLPPMLEVSKG
ncbi:MAG: hypothetical protein IKZ82_08320 [Clostridia bacterium]|nr:hypothetical protein [Clostridia bacterium]